MLSEINVFGIRLQTYWLVMGLGFFAMLLLMLWRRKRYGLTRLQAALFTVLVMASGVLGCKLLYILESIPEVMENGISAGGFSFFGAVFLIPPLMVLAGKGFHLGSRQSLDATAPCVTLMIAMMRVGCFLNGCCGGVQATLLRRTFVWPTQAMESVGDVCILLWLLAREEKQAQGGTLYPCFMLTYGILRFFIEFLRDTPKDWLHLSHGQWFSIAAVIAALIALKSIQKRTQEDKR